MHGEFRLPAYSTGARAHGLVGEIICGGMRRLQHDVPQRVQYTAPAA